MSDAWKKNVFRKTCITYSVLEFIETMNATFTSSWQSYITSSRYLKKWKILLKMFWQTQKVCRMLNIFLLPKLTCRQNNGPSPSSWIVVAILLCLTNSTPSDSSLRYIKIIISTNTLTIDARGCNWYTND